MQFVDEEIIGKGVRDESGTNAGSDTQPLEGKLPGGTEGTRARDGDAAGSGLRQPDKDGNGHSHTGGSGRGNGVGGGKNPVLPDTAPGLNLQRLGTLINIDLPWNPTRLEQRKGRIQRIGQARDEVWIANLRYRESVEDRVHRVLADRLEAIHELFGQIPDTLEDVWVEVALQNEQAARQLIDRTTATRNPFDVKYSKVEDADWETCASVLNAVSMRELLSTGW